MAAPGRKNKIKKIGPQAEQMVAQERADGQGYRAIADKISEHFNKDVSHESVRNYLQKHSNDRRMKMAEENLAYIKEQEMKEILDVGDQLQKLNEKLQNAMDNIDEDEVQNAGVLVQLSREIRKQLKFHKEFVEEVVNPTTVEGDVNVTQNYSAMEINNYLFELEEKGIIDIKDDEELRKMSP